MSVSLLIGCQNESIYSYCDVVEDKEILLILRNSFNYNFHNSNQSAGFWMTFLIKILKFGIAFGDKNIKYGLTLSVK